MPGPLPDPVLAKLPQDECLDGTSDDGTGNYLLGYTAGRAGPTYPNYLFFTIQDGKAVNIGDTVPGGDENGTYVYSQPSGFTAFHVSGRDGGSDLDSYSHGGKLTRSQSGVKGTLDFSPSSAIGIDPSGGTGLARQYHTSSGYVTSYQRLDKTGAPETGEVVIDESREDHWVSAVGVTLSGHALVVAHATSSTWQARWLARDGTPITGWFLINGPGGFPSLQFLMDGGLALGFGQYFSRGGTYAYRVPDSVPAAEPLPDWLQERAANQFAAIRNGRGYASWGTAGQCSAKSVEVLATTGKSCGCVDPPNAKGFNIGRDGSLIVSEAPINFGTCVFDLYPQLLK